MKNLSLNIHFKRDHFSISADIKIELKGITLLSGKSGEGKTSLLRCLAGFEKNCYGSIQFNNIYFQNSIENIFIPPYRRKIGYIFQENFLFPNLNVVENIYYGAKRRHCNNIEMKDIIKILKIEHLLFKRVTEISGGEKQKVSLARTLVNAPDLILMDEPLNSIDETSKNDIMAFLNEFKYQYSIPIIFVTHCSFEKEKLGNAEIILDKGILTFDTKKQSLCYSDNSTQKLNYFKTYQKQFNLEEFGFGGQQKLLAAKILCVGAGGLGSPVCLYLAASGVGNIGIVDDDTVELSNLQRQILYHTKSVGKDKLTEAFASITKINPNVKVELFKTKVHAINAENIIKNYDIILDCTDNFASNYLLGDVCAKLNKPLVYSCVNGFDGQIAVFSPEYGGCFRCLFKHFPKNHSPSCNVSGVLGPACGIIGSMQAMQAIYLALGYGQCRKNKLNILFNQVLKIDLKNFSISNFSFQKNVKCILCSKNPNDIIISDYQVSCIIDEETPELLLHEIENKSNYTIVDIREENEYQLSHICNAINIPLSWLLQNNIQLKMDKKTQMIVYCQGNRRSLKAIKILKSYGFMNIIRLKNGYEGNFF